MCVCVWKFLSQNYGVAIIKLSLDENKLISAINKCYKKFDFLFVYEYIGLNGDVTT